MAQGYPPRRPPAGPGGPGTGRHGYPEQPGEPGRQEYRSDPGARGAGGSTGRHGYREEPGYSGDSRYPEDGGYAGDRGYAGESGYADDPGSGGDPGYGDREYPDNRGYSGDLDEPERRRGSDGRGPGRAERAPRRRADTFDDDEDVMPWTGPGIYPVGPGQRQRRPPPEPADDEQFGEPDGDGFAASGRRADTGRGRRAAAARARKSRRRLILGGVVLVVVVVVVLGVMGKLPFEGGPASSPNDGLVTTYQPGEFRTVPNACDSLGAATLSQYLPGKVAVVSQSPGGPAQSQCTWTLDTRPNFRVLTVTTQAYAPSLLSSGNGSATRGAIDAYNQQLQTLRNPPASSKAPKAQLGGAVGLGSDAFTALQVFHLQGDVSDEVTVVARDRNVVIVVTMQGQESGGGFGPVPDATLRAGALAAAHHELAALR